MDGRVPSLSCFLFIDADVDADGVGRLIGFGPVLTVDRIFLKWLRWDLRDDVNIGGMLSSVLQSSQ